MCFPQDLIVEPVGVFREGSKGFFIVVRVAKDLNIIWVQVFNSLPVPAVYVVKIVVARFADKFSALHAFVWPLLPNLGNNGFVFSEISLISFHCFCLQNARGNL